MQPVPTGPKLQVGTDKKQKVKHRIVVLASTSAAVLLLVVAGGVVLLMNLGSGQKKQPVVAAKTQQQNTAETSGPNATDPVARGKYLSHDNCSGTGSKTLSAAPMNPSDLSVILPYGLTAGGHVTPVDHQYFLGKNQAAAASTYSVYAPADGAIVSVEARPRGTGATDYRVVISYSCTFFSYFDLANSLAPTLAAKLPAGYQTKSGPQYVKVPVKQGQVLAMVGGQSLDFAVWDTTKTMSGLLVPKAYNNYEPWKINTVEPTAYYTDQVKAQLLPLYARTVEPRDGRIGYDIDGTASGNWFKQGTNGYIGSFKESTFNPQTYADGHLSIAPDLYDPSGWIFSTGAVNHGTQYAIKAPTTTPDKLTVGGEPVKYQLVQVRHVDELGRTWLGAAPAKSITLSTTYATAQGTALVQLTAKRELKVELFPGKTPAQVTTFTTAATLYTRGDDATTMSR